jgi:hypothetical protein
MKKRKITISIFLLLLCCVRFAGVAYAEMLERVVAVVNEDVILLSELRSEVQLRKSGGAEASEADVLDEMIDRMLLLAQTEKMRLEEGVDPDKTLAAEDKMINDYIERRVKAFIHIPLKDMEDYYSRNTSLYGGKKFYDVKDEIEAKLVEARLQDRLREHIRGLRKDSYIRVQLK